MNIRNTYLITLSLCFISLSTQAGEVIDACFSYPAVAMTPYDKSQNDYRATHSKVYHKDSITKDILLYGPVQILPHDAINKRTSLIFKAHGQDPDGRSPGAQIIAELRFINYNGGIHIIETLKSNENPDMRTEVALTPRTDGYYIVRMYIQRSSTNLRPTAIGYQLCDGYIVS